MLRSLSQSILILAIVTATGCNQPIRVLSIAGGHAYDTSEFYQALSKQGTPMLFLHHSLGTFQEWDGYREMVGGNESFQQLLNNAIHWLSHQ